MLKYVYDIWFILVDANLSIYFFSRLIIFS